MSPEEFQEWRAADRYIEPLLASREDRQAALIAAAVYNASGNFKEVRKIKEALAELQASFDEETLEPHRRRRLDVRPARPELVALFRARGEAKSSTEPSPPSSSGSKP